VVADGDGVDQPIEGFVALVLGATALFVAVGLGVFDLGQQAVEILGGQTGVEAETALVRR